MKKNKIRNEEWLEANIPFLFESPSDYLQSTGGFATDMFTSTFLMSQKNTIEMTNSMSSVRFSITVFVNKLNKNQMIYTLEFRAVTQNKIIDFLEGIIVELSTLLPTTRFERIDSLSFMLTKENENKSTIEEIVNKFFIFMKYPKYYMENECFFKNLSNEDAQLIEMIEY